jgi:hypothetical protein
MEPKELTPMQALNIVFAATGDLKLNRQDMQVLDKAIQTLSTLIPKEEEPND